MLLCFNTTDFTVPLLCNNVTVQSHNADTFLWVCSMKHQMKRFSFFSLSTPDVCRSLGTKHCCVWRFSFHGDWNTADWKKQQHFARYPPSLPPSSPCSHLWSTDLLTTRGVNMVITAFIWLEADRLQLSLNIWIFWGKLQRTTTLSKSVSAF